MKLTATIANKDRLCSWCDEQATYEIDNNGWAEYACDKHLEEHCSRYISK
ncbi:MAG: hypothetical protein WC749_02470 [Dehalococcoidia bacterium]